VENPVEKFLYKGAKPHKTVETKRLIGNYKIRKIRFIQRFNLEKSA
jgi:hypothetical protein